MPDAFNGERVILDYCVKIMFQVPCLNKISKVGTSCFSDNYITTEILEAADAILVRCAGMHEMDFSNFL